MKLHVTTKTGQILWLAIKHNSLLTPVKFCLIKNQDFDLILLSISMAVFISKLLCKYFPQFTVVKIETRG